MRFRERDSLKGFLGDLGGAVLAVLLVTVFAGAGMGDMGSMVGGGMMGGALFVPLFWVMVVAPIAALITRIVGQSRQR